MRKENTAFLCPFNKNCDVTSRLLLLQYLTLSYPGGGGAKYAINLKFSEFKDTLLRPILQVKPVRCCHGNKITEGTSQDLAPKKSEKSAICRDIELKFGTGTNFGPLS